MFLKRPLLQNSCMCILEYAILALCDNLLQFRLIRFYIFVNNIAWFLCKKRVFFVLSRACSERCEKSYFLPGIVTQASIQEHYLNLMAPVRFCLPLLPTSYNTVR